VLYLLLGDLFGLPYTIWRQRTRRQPTDAELAAIILRQREQAVDDLRTGRSAPYCVSISTLPPGLRPGL
jgi:hypothetical protein